MIKMTNKILILKMKDHTKQATKNSETTVKPVYINRSITTVTTVTISPIIIRGSGSASTGSVDTDPLVGTIPKPFRGDAYG